MKYRMAARILNRKLKSVHRNNRFHNLQSAVRIGIIWMDDVPEEQEASKWLTSFFEGAGKKVTPIPFLSTEMEEIDERTITPKAFNWLGFPKTDLVQSHLSAGYDMLICLSMKFSLEMRNFIAMSNADFKIGKKTSATEAFDFSLNISSNRTPQFLAEQIRHYLDIIQ
ncbi:hypothetical protein EYV94_21265 [Puteibacter caeruleilacunae]|nr:hypothetical protein EYV94_21265 [Puteibacter caeruleilacunae]